VAKRNGAKVTTRAANVPVPQDRSEANAAIAEIGVLGRELERLQADMNDQIARIKERFELKAEPGRDRIEALTAGLGAWCEANRDQLTNGGKVKYHRFAAGEVSWRNRPAKVTVRGAEQVIAALKERDLTRFVRVSEEVDKEAVLADKAAVAGIKGLSIGSEGEDFSVTPFEAELAQASGSAR
jgi:phage host-nuclease inhibitor protein Gam